MREDIGTAGTEPNRPIQLLARDCDELFRESLQSHPQGSEEVISLIDEYYRAFTSWISFLCVFETSDSCLDYRLRKHPSVQDIIIRLLEILRQNTYLLSSSGYLNIIESPKEPQGHAGSSVSEIRTVLTGIQDSMMRLNKLALSIRQSSRSSAITLARNFATTNRDLDDLEDLVLIALETLYPNAPESLRKQLCDTMTDRYAKLEYNAYRRGKSQACPLKRLEHSEVTSGRGDQGQGPASSMGLPSTNLKDSEVRQEDTQAIDQVPQRKPLSSIDTGLLRQSLGNDHIPTPQSRRTLSAYQTDSRLHEPPPPQFEDDETHTECEWCHEVIDRSLVRDKGWSDIGRRHYRSDLKPFPCLSETCGESRPSFSSRAEWLKHMRSRHSAVWSQKVHRQRMWLCNDHVEPEGSIMYAFSSKNELERHILLLHPSNTSLSDDDVTEAAAQQLSLDETPSLDLCPLCLFVEKGTMDSEEDKVTEAETSSLGDSKPTSAGTELGKDNKKFSDKREARVTFADDVPPASDDTGSGSDHGSENSPLTVFDLELHVAAHLQYLMVLSLRLVATLDDHNTEGGGSGLSDSATGSISPREEGIQTGGWPEEESTRSYLSDSELRRLEQTRSKEEGDKILLHPKAEENWIRVQNSILQQLRSRHEESSGSQSYRSGTHETPQPLRDCLKSLAFPQMDNRRNNIDTATNGTCLWLLLHDTYKRWATCDRGLLWVKGKPGSGKSTLLRYALDNVMVAPNIEDRTLVLSFFFHGHGTGLQQTPLGLFRSLLHQLLTGIPHALPDFVDAFEKKRKQMGEPGNTWHWHLNELQGFFKTSLPKVLESHSICLFVDALDESGQNNAVELVREFKSLAEGLPSTRFQFRICFTSRHYPILDLYCQFEICLERENKQDILTYVQVRLSEFQVRTASTISTLITRRASGVFMWARLMVDQVLDLEGQGQELSSIEKAIYAIPQELYELYLKLVRGMHKKPDSLKLIQWICFAVRPLSLDELRWAMVIDADCPHASLQQCQGAADYASGNDMMERRVKTLSCGLAEVVPSSKALVVQFIHPSVKDFFIEMGISALDNSLKTTELVVGIAHYRLSRTCIRYLAMKEIAWSKARDREGLMSTFPLLHYATTSWVAHARHSETRNHSQDDLLDYFDWPSDYLVQRWVGVYRILEHSSTNSPPNGTSMVHIVSRYQLIGPLRVILQRADREKVDIDARDEYGRTPLSWAAEKGHEAIVKLLLNTGKVDIDSKDEYGRMPLWLAAKNGHEAVVKLLLDIGKIDVGSKDEYGRTLLSWAAEKGNEAIVKLLLNTGKVDIDSKDKYGRTPLSWAAEKGHEAIVKLLLNTGKVDINFKEYYNSRTPLSWAAEKGNEAIVKLLLSIGKVDVDSKDEYGQTPLWLAAKNGHEAVVKVLLDTGKVDIDSKESYSSRTPLSWAAKNGHKAVVKLLLDTGKVDIDSKESYSNRTPLSWAAENGHEAIVKLLLDTGKVDIDSKDKYGRTPLSWTAEKGHEAVVKLLLDTGKVDINFKEYYNSRTPLSWAAENEHEAVVQLLQLMK